MNHLFMMFMMVLFLSLIFNNVKAQHSEEENMPEIPETGHPSKGLVISVLTVMLAITLLLLAYVKFCRFTPLDLLNPNPNNTLQNFQGLTRSRSRFSGIERNVIETLPFFKFSSLKGSKEGLECTVCLSKFEDSEILRLLPKCQHAFHMSCIDTWFERHSTCPLCRYRVEPGDIKNLNYSFSSRFLRVPSNLAEDPNLEIYVQREPSNRGSSSRFNVGKSKKQEELLIDDHQLSGGSNGTWTRWNKNNHVHKLNHRIVISDVVTRSRWSDLNSSDLVSLSFEMLNDVSSSARFYSPLEQNNNNNGENKLQGASSLLVVPPSAAAASCSNDEGENSFTAMNPAEKRSMSEIANVPRFIEFRKQSRDRESVACSAGGDSNLREERLWRIWMPIARRTVQWFARRETNSSELRHKVLCSSNV